MTSPYTLQQRRGSKPEPAAEPSRPSRRRRAGVAAAGLLGVAWVLAAACTLTSDDYEPPLVATDPLMSQPPGEVVATPEPDAGGCPDGADCCAAIPCDAVGESCVDGSCRAPTPLDAGVPPACVGDDCPGSMPPVPLAPSCDDGVQNGDETGSDCGGGCPQSCGVDVGCVSDADCGEGLFCPANVEDPEGARRCTAVSCTDRAQNGSETALDCGGGSCPACEDGAACSVGTDCESLVCGEDGTCSAPSCNDDQLNGAETGADCGGPCPQNCDNGLPCAQNGDCQSGVCRGQGCDDGVELCCQQPRCNDNVQNGNESDVDCGSLACGQCSLGDTCLINLQCDTGLCQDFECEIPPPRCDDGIENGTESDLDCGGGCAPCPDLSDCNQATDCASTNCDPNGTCISCGDGVRNGTETAIDCGGADLACRRCNGGEACASNSDCVNQFCLGGLCT